MPRWAYTGLSAGLPTSGELDGADAGSVAGALQQRGIAPLTILPAAERKPARVAARPRAGWWAPKVTAVDLMLFSRQLHTLLRSGVPILRALAGLQDSCANVTFKATIGELRHHLESGIELSMGLAQQGPVFDSFYIAMVRVGEMTGRLDEVLRRLSDHVAFELFIRQQVKSALRYPAFVIAAMVIAVGVINALVMPAFAQVFAAFQATLPLPTRLLLGFSSFTLQWGWLIVLLAVAAAVWWRAWKATPAGRLAWDRLCLRLPLAGPIVHKATLSRFSRSFALAMKSGLPIEQTLAVTAQTVDNAWIARQVDGMRDAVERGDTILRAATASGVFTPVVLQMIAVGEETGAIDELMDEIAHMYSEEVQYQLKTLSQQIEPILITFLGVMVLVLALGVFMPMWDLGHAAIKK